MSQIPNDLKYTNEHEWIRLQDGERAEIGITDYAQSSLGDVTFVELPTVGDEAATEESFGVVESVKAASDLYMPVGGEFVEVNEALLDEPELINKDPYGAGWIVRIQMHDPGEIESLMSPEAYKELVGD